MDLRTYLFNNHMTTKDFSVLCGCSYHYMCRIVRGNTLPGDRLAKDIEILTAGQVKRDEISYKKLVKAPRKNKADN